MLRRLFLSLVISTSAVSLYAQTGSIKGSVKDVVSGEPLIGANVFVQGTGQGAAVDVEGNFSISKVKAGTYSLAISSVSYKADTLKNITVYADQTTVVNTTLH